MKVHRTLGSGFLESVYQQALLVELRELELSCEIETPLEVRYRGHIVGGFLADIIVEGAVILELKSCQALNEAHEVQLVNYLTATGIENGLLLNFGASSLEVKRKFKNYKNSHPVNLVNPVQKTQINAFTMLELLVAMAVFSLLIVMLMGIVDSGTKLWRESENRVDAYRESRAAISMMERDLRNALAMNNTNYIRINAGAFPQLQEADVQKNTNTASAMFFLAAQPASSQDLTANKSDVCEVGYFLAYGNSSAGPANSGLTKSMNLYRYFRSSDGTFSNLTNGSSSLFTNVTITGAESDLLARNIKSFRITPYHLDTNGSIVAYSAAIHGALPDLVEISITALNQDTSRRMVSASDWTSTNSPLAHTIKQVEQTFTTRVRLQDKL